MGTISQDEVMVIGGGPAGLATAIAARLKGFSVTVTDAAQPPIDKACGEGILPAGVEALRRLGVPLCESDGFSIRGIRFIDGDRSVEAQFGAGSGIGVKRIHLHGLLMRRAEELGVQLRWGAAVRRTGGLSQGQWMVGADGQGSRVRREAQLDGAHSCSTRFGFRRHYRIAPWTDRVEIYWGASCQVYVTPVGSDEVGVALLCGDSKLRLDGALAEFPALARRLETAWFRSTERGGTTISRRLRRVFNGRTALVGDASGSADAIGGEGLSLAFLQAFALADALAVGDLRAYQAAHRRLARRAAISANALLLLSRLPRLRRVVLQGLAFEPSIFSLLLAQHSPACPPSERLTLT